MKSNKIQPQFIQKYNPRIGLIALATDFIIEKDFIKIIKDKDIDFFVNRIECYNPLSKENLIKGIERGEISHKTVDDSYQRIIKTKQKLVGFVNDEMILELILEENLKLAEEMRSYLIE